jgi:hydroxypyruvate isomerase
VYTEYPFLDRFEAAARDGFKAVEYLFPYAWSAEVLSAKLHAHGLQQVLFNAPPGGQSHEVMACAWDNGMRGTACIPGREGEFRAGVEMALDYARALQCPRIHVMAGLMPSSGDVQSAHATYIANLTWAARMASAQGVTVLIEPINVRDMPGYFLNYQQQAHDVLAQVGAANLKVQMDLYHCQIMEGDLASRLQRYVPAGAVGHVQIAGVPARNEPDTGEVNYAFLLELLDTLGYESWVGCEYRPRQCGQAGGTRAGLQWLAPYLR